MHIDIRQLYVLQVFRIVRKLLIPLIYRKFSMRHKQNNRLINRKIL